MVLISFLHLNKDEFKFGSHLLNEEIVSLQSGLTKLVYVEYCTVSVIALNIAAVSN